MIDDKQLSELESISDHFANRKARAKERLQKVDGRWWCFGIIGLKTDFDDVAVNELVRLRRVTEPPGEVELAGAMHTPAWFSAVARHSQSLTHELAVNSTFGGENGPAQLAWWFMSALRVRTGCDVLIPVVADLPWDTIAGAAEHSVQVRMLEDFPSAFRFESDVVVNGADIAWVEDKLTVFAELLEHPAFRLASEAATTHHHHANLRMTTASLWAGLEAIFQISMELRFRIAALVASFLEPPGESRIKLNRDVKKLYDFRSKAVHGSAAKEEDLREHVRVTRVLLRRILCAITEHGKMLTVEEFEERLFGGK